MKTVLPRVSCTWLRQHQSQAPSVCSYTTDKTRGENCKGAPKHSHQISLQSVARTFYTKAHIPMVPSRMSMRTVTWRWWRPWGWWWRDSWRRPGRADPAPATPWAGQPGERLRSGAGPGPETRAASGAGRSAWGRVWVRRSQSIKLNLKCDDCRPSTEIILPAQRTNVQFE